ncbi:MAG TPA: 50S ribosomal protein L15 [Candidatus Dormibacteraeota bacterium]|nr:50S ribosomal protein L15 [Candidatus Dormibacteraeota bacterium]
MRLHDLKPARGSRAERKRIGRGISAGQGKTSGRGQKGQGSRSSVGLPRGFEGGQLRLAQRLPKLRGFHNRWRKEYAEVNLGKLSGFEAGATVDAEALAERGVIGRKESRVKVLAAGEVRVALQLKVHRISAAARKAVEAAGGSVELLESTERTRRRRKADTKGKKAAAAGEEAAE